jgi:PKD repeat protein
MMRIKGNGRNAVAKAVGGIMVVTALVAVPAMASIVPVSANPSASSGTPVPASGTFAAQLVTSAASAATSAPRTVPLRVRNPARFASAKAAADAAYAAWAAEHSVSPAVTPLSSIVGLNKPGLNAPQAGGGTPPDTTGAIGPASYLEMVNSEIAVRSRATLASPPIASALEDTFVGSSSTCDGQIKWDQAAQRFLYSSLDCHAPAGSQGFSFGWSKTANPLPLTGATANWCRYHVGTGSNLEDYGKLGNDNSFMILGVNEFAANGSTYTASPIFTVPKPANGSTTCPATPTLTKFTPSPANEYTPEPANIFASSANGYIAAISGSVNNALRMYTLTGTTTPSLLDNGNIAVPAFSVPAGVPQPGTGDVLDSLDTRLTQANAAYDPTIHAFGIWTQHTVAGPAGGPSVVRWYELKAGQVTPVQTGTVAVSGAFAFNGAIAPNRAGNAAAIDYDVGSWAQKVQVRARVHVAGSALGTMASETTLATSAGIDNDFSCNSRRGSGASSTVGVYASDGYVAYLRPCRWGDYGGASTDPVGCGAAVWGTNELNNTPDGFGDAEWQSQNFQLLVDECPTAAFTFSPASPVHARPVSFNGTSSVDADGSIVTYAWAFGDGAKTTGANAKPTHTYATKGTYNATLTVVDSSGLQASATHAVVVS